MERLLYRSGGQSGRRGSRRARGTSVIEFALVASPLLIMLFGVTVVGLNLGRSVQSSQVCRDAASMYVRGIDFTQSGNKDILVRLANGLGMTQTGGKGVVILSKVTWIPAADCQALNLNPCNSDQHVITQRIVIGNQSLRSSALGTPDPAKIDNLGLVKNYMQEPTAVATFPYMQLNDGEFAYVAEAYFSTPEFDMPGFHSGTGTYSISIF